MKLFIYIEYSGENNYHIVIAKSEIEAHTIVRQRTKYTENGITYDRKIELYSETEIRCGYIGEIEY